MNVCDSTLCHAVVDGGKLVLGQAGDIVQAAKVGDSVHLVGSVERVEKSGTALIAGEVQAPAGFYALADYRLLTPVTD